MPLDADGHWMNDKVVGQDEIVAAIDAVYPLEQLPARGAAPADRFRYLDGGGTIGVIPTVTKPFCGDCDRVRLTADGQFRTCLFATKEFDLLAAMRCGRVRRSHRRTHRGRGRDEVGRPPHQPGQLRAPRQVDEPDRRLSRRDGAEVACRGDSSAEVGVVAEAIGDGGIAEDLDRPRVALPQPEQQIVGPTPDRRRRPWRGRG